MWLCEAKRKVWFVAMLCDGTICTGYSETTKRMLRLTDVVLKMHPVCSDVTMLNIP